MIRSLFGLGYKERLHVSQLPALRYRQQGGMIQLVNHVSKKYDVNFKL